MHGLVLPITALVVGDAVLGAELRSGTFSFTWLSPVSFATIVLGRWLGGCVVAAALLAPAAVVGALAAGTPAGVLPAIVAIVSGSAAYVALFLAVGATFRRAVVVSLVLVILVERLLGAALHSVAQLTPGWLAQNALTGLVDLPRLRIDGVPYGWSAVGRLAMVAAFGLVVAMLRMPRLRPASAAD
jgi:ABC-type transport system involved in multi-copper enzyme maturation permease subunit